MKFLYALFCIVSTYAWGLSQRDVGVHFVIVIPSYNNKNWYQKNIDSVLMQKYTNYHAMYINDCSTDSTDQLVATYLKEKDIDRKMFLVNNTQRVGALANIYRAVHFCQDDQVIVLLDGDDWLAHEDVLSKLAAAYAHKKSWLVYSQFMQLPMNEYGWNCTFTKSEYQSANIPRNYSPSHLRTFYAGLFKKIKLEDLVHEQQFFQMSWDKAIMLPMMEMARAGHCAFIPEVLYIYNTANPLNDHKVDLELQKKLDMLIRSKKKYDALPVLFE